MKPQLPQAATAAAAGSYSGGRGKQLEPFRRVEPERLVSFYSGSEFKITACHCAYVGLGISVSTDTYVTVFNICISDVNQKS